jgi:hypothetical protein
VNKRAFGPLDNAADVAAWATLWRDAAMVPAGADFDIADRAGLQAARQITDASLLRHVVVGEFGWHDVEVADGGRHEGRL